MRKRTITMWTVACILVGVVAIVAGIMGRGFGTENSAAVDGEILAWKITISVGVVLVGIGTVLGWLRISQPNDGERNVHPA